MDCPVDSRILRLPWGGGDKSLTQLSGSRVDQVNYPKVSGKKTLKAAES